MEGLPCLHGFSPDTPRCGGGINGRLYGPVNVQATAYCLTLQYYCWLRCSNAAGYGSMPRPILFALVLTSKVVAFLTMSLAPQHMVSIDSGMPLPTDRASLSPGFASEVKHIGPLGPL